MNHQIEICKNNFTTSVEEFIQEDFQNNDKRKKNFEIQMKGSLPLEHIGRINQIMEIKRSRYRNLSRKIKYVSSALRRFGSILSPGKIRKRDYRIGKIQLSKLWKKNWIIILIFVLIFIRKMKKLILKSRISNLKQTHYKIIDDLSYFDLKQNLKSSKNSNFI